MIIEWIIESQKKTGMIGVFYTSTLYNNDIFYDLNFEWDNIAIPIQKLFAKNYCTQLKELFLFTKPTCYEYEYFSGHIEFLKNKNNIPLICIDLDKEKDYHKSIFYKMEELLHTKYYGNIDYPDEE